MAKSSKPVTRRKTVAAGTVAPVAPVRLLNDLRELINDSRQRVAHALNAALVLLYWEVGRRIRVEILKQKRADYGEQIVHALSAQLAADFGCGFGKRNLFNMVRFAEVFPDEQIVSALSGQLSWTHQRQIVTSHAINRSFSRWSSTVRVIEYHWSRNEKRDSSSFGSRECNAGELRRR